VAASVDASRVDVAVIGAGPCGLAAAIAARAAGLSCVVYDRGALVSGLAGYPTDMTFFSTAERLAIGGVPFLVAEAKPTKRDALAYYRGVASHHALDVRLYETVEALRPVRVDLRAGEPEPAAASARPPQWLVQSVTRAGVRHELAAHAVVVATGYFGRPNRLGVPGESLPHVRHGYVDAHEAWGQRVVIVGGANSAVDAALAMHRVGAQVTLVHFAEGLDANVKPWVRPGIEARLKEGVIGAHFGSRVVEITTTAVVVEGPGGRTAVPASQVYTMTGYLPETGLLEAVGVPIDATTGIPAHDPDTMATPLAGLYLAGVIASGNQANRIFIENGRDHGTAIARHLTRTHP